MCGRYAFFSPHEAVLGYFELPSSSAPIEPRFNIAPTQQVAAVRATEGGGRELALLHWGLVPAWAKERSVGSRMINARAETLREKSSFRIPFDKRRCLVLADGYYEWQVTREGPKQPYFIRRADRAPFGMAGLWESWRGPAGVQPLESCVIVTRAASADLSHVHLRMPLIIPRESYAAWLDPAVRSESVAPLLSPAAAEPLVAIAVSRRVNSPSQQGAELLEPIANVEA
jgi:putative SOS response-associated peptidase YedK